MRISKYFVSSSYCTNSIILSISTRAHKQETQAVKTSNITHHSLWQSQMLSTSGVFKTVKNPANLQMPTTVSPDGRGKKRKVTAADKEEVESKKQKQSATVPSVNYVMKSEILVEGAKPSNLSGAHPELFLERLNWYGTTMVRKKVSLILSRRPFFIVIGRIQMRWRRSRSSRRRQVSLLV
jgi:hypothetical protein